MREDVKKFLFIGSQDDKDYFFKKAQSMGIIHFIDPLSRSHKEIPEDVQRVGAAIKILRGLPPVEQEENFTHLDSDQIVKDILDLQGKKERLEEELRVLSLEIARISVFGNFSLEDIAYIEKEGKRKVQFFVGRPSLFDEEPLPEELIYIASEHNLDYYVAINPRSVVYDRMIEMKIDHSLAELRARMAQSQDELHEVEHRLKGYAKYNEFLHRALVDKLNEYHLYNAQTYVQEAMGGMLFAVEGWVPINKEDQVETLVSRLNVYAEEIAIEPTDVVPTYLENEGLGRLGEDLVHIYDTPSATDKDPSKWVLWCFTLFFAFIIADAGYGLVYLALALFLRYKFPNLKGAGKRALNLFTVLCVGCVVWGTLMTSFFGMSIDINNPLRKLSLVQWLAEKKVEYHIVHRDAAYQEWIEKYPTLSHVTDRHEFVSFVPSSDPQKGHIVLNKITDNIMFELALFIGVVHLILSLLRYARRNPPNIGWAIFLVGAYLYFPSYLHTPSFLNTVGGIDLEKGGKVGFQLMMGGIGFAWLASIFIHKWKGIFEIMTLIQVFADTLSYLRLYALGLAGAIVGSTINEIASGLPLIFAVLLIVVSHMVNIVLGTMSGIIHGLRLNFLEWYHYSFEGGGKQFQPLKLLKKE
ncbi:V-type ATP synthase subunit I [Candidatus Protochlamydia phocaeensis]|uniref:V-type ATP synthase subunit I n=1 Tax=Candidatus Protochlamydia phocaeensis TaxID=1414722 RepID=UPI0008389DFA|nr:V-type ATP synthase subunit I [Candidatus Protochlamydia phocaeensis]